MVHAVSGQYEQWVQLQAASQVPPTSQTSLASWLAFMNASSGTPDTTAVSSDTSSSMSDEMSLALMAFGGGAPSPQVSGQTAASTADTSSDATDISTSGTITVEQMLTDLQSLMSALGGTASSASDISSAGTTAASSDASSIANGGTGELSSALLLDLQQVASDISGMSAAMGTPWPGATGMPNGPPPFGPPPGPPPASGDISNTGSVSAASASDALANTGTTAASDSGFQTFMQQFAYEAYAQGYSAGLDGATASSLASISA